MAIVHEVYLSCNLEGYVGDPAFLSVFMFVLRYSEAAYPAFTDAGQCGTRIVVRIRLMTDSLSLACTASIPMLNVTGQKGRGHVSSRQTAIGRCRTTRTRVVSSP